MAAAPQPLTPPPGALGAPPMAPTSPTAVSPSPAQASPAEGGTRLIVDIARGLLALKKMYPGTGPIVAQMFESVRALHAKVMEHQEPGQPMAPPVSG